MSAVLVTGLGAVSPFGVGVKAYWDGVRSGSCAIRPLTLFATDGFRSRVAAEVPGPLPGSSRRSRADRLALAAAREAIDDAGLGPQERSPGALVVGAVGGGMLEAEAAYWASRRAGGATVPPAAQRSVLPYSHAAVLAHQLGLRGPRSTIVTACGSGATSLAVAADLIAAGLTPFALAGGVDALTRICFMGFNALRLLDPGPCRPFDRDRRGMSIGEGAAFVVLENARHARARGARVYARLAGHGMTTDAFHVTSPQPEGEGMVRAMQAALRRAQLEPGAVGYANAHGTGTLQNDRTEARALATVFGAGRLLVSSTKSMIGHTMAAAGSLEAIATVLALVGEIVPPTVHLSAPDPEVPFDCVPDRAREIAVGAAISNSFGFGGQNVTLLFQRA
jgi:3-oxoacyl-[acyl-carrier-protein] synthase II